MRSNNSLLAVPICVVDEKYSRNPAPDGILGGAVARWHSSMTIKIEKARREFPEELLTLLRAGDRLIEAQISFIADLMSSNPIIS